MRCVKCQHTSSRVLESRSTENGQSIRRRRECLACRHRFTTYERIEFVPISIIKKDSKRESFDRSKLLRGMVRACEKTPISTTRLEIIVDEIETRLQQYPEREVSSQDVGQMVLDYLQTENEVAYIRFASVYGQFQGISDFVRTLEQFQAKPVPQA
ncbi:MAG: transcriptional regulator NrdR [Cyanobacteria bacterium P01_H01_bin.15]